MKTCKQIFKYGLTMITSVLVVVSITYAWGSLTPDLSTVTNTSYTLTDIDNLINSNTRVNSGSGAIPATPSGSPSQTFKSISDIYNDLKTELDKLGPDKIVQGTEVFGIVGTVVPAEGGGLVWQPPLSGDSTYEQLCYSANAYELAGDQTNPFLPGPCVSGVTGSGLTSNNEGALEYCANLVYGGNSNWRLPTTSEIRSALATAFYINVTESPSSDGFTKYSGSVINAGGAFYTPGIYWTSSIVSSQQAKVGYYSDTTGLNFSSSMSRVNRHAVRCVHD